MRVPTTHIKSWAWPCLRGAKEGHTIVHAPIHTIVHAHTQKEEVRNGGRKGTVPYTKQREDVIAGCSHLPALKGILLSFMDSLCRPGADMTITSQCPGDSWGNKQPCSFPLSHIAK